jgi:endonuclease I
VQNVKVENNTLIWDEIIGATFNIYVDGALITTVSTNSLNLNTLISTECIYSIEIETLPFGLYILPSEPVEYIYDFNFNYYSNINDDLVGEALKLELRELLIETHTNVRSYDNLKQDLLYTDASLYDEEKVVLFYSRLEIDAVWDADYWNREHVWPKSLGWFKESGAGSDLHHIRPSDPTVNGAKGNKRLGEVENGTIVYISQTNGGGNSGCEYNTNYFEPSDEVKGDVARIIFYLFTRYSQSDSYDSTSVAESLEVLLDWHNQDPVDEWEMRRNERTYEIQGNRNPFIDHPEYAFLIWG